MKLLIRISSIRRIAWKQCRSCSADSDSMWRDSLAEVLARRMDPLSLRLEHPGHRVLRQPVDLQPVDEVAQLAGDRGVALGVAEADRRGDVEGALAPVGAVDGRVARRRARRRTRASRGSPEPACARAGGGRRPSTVSSRPPVIFASALPSAYGVIWSFVPWMTSTGHLTRSREGDLLAAAGGRRELPLDAEGERRAVGVERPGDGVLDLLRRVRLGQHPLGPPLHEVARSRPFSQ